MIQHCRIYQNPLIAPGYYFAKVTDLDIEETEGGYPKLGVHLKLHPQYQLEIDELYAILYPSDKSGYHYKNFFNTYMLGKSLSEIKKAIGKWGCVELYSAHYQEQEYSAVKFIYQPRRIMLEAYRLQRDADRSSKNC